MIRAFLITWLTLGALAHAEDVPRLLEPPPARFPLQVGKDSFGLPIRWSYRTVFPQRRGMKPQTGDTMDDIIGRLPIRGVMPAREVLIQSQRVPVNGTFVLKNGDQLLKLRVELISSLEIIFSVGDDPTLYRYQIPPGAGG